MMTTPVPVNVTLLPEMVAGPSKTVKVTGKPELAVAVSVKGAEPKTRSGRAPKVIVWDLVPTVAAVTLKER